MNNLVRSGFGSSTTFTALLITYLFTYIALSDMFRKLDPLVEKLSQVYKLTFVGSVFFFNAIGLGMIILGTYTYWTNR